MMNILRAEHSAEYPYVMMSKATANNRGLSLAARGLLAWLLDKPDSWNIDPDAIARLNDTTLYEIKKLLNELTREGYLTPPQRQHVKGRWQYTPYVLRETPNVAVDIEIEIPENSDTKTDALLQDDCNSMTVSDDLPRAEDKHEIAAEQITKTNNNNKTGTETETKTDNPPVANPELPDPEPVAVSVSKNPVQNQVINLDIRALILPGVPLLPASVPERLPSKPEIEYKHNDLWDDAQLDREIPGLKPGDPPLYKPDLAWKRVQEAFEGITGGTISKTISDLLNDGIALRGVDAVVGLIESARNAHTNRIGMVVNALKNWQREPIPAKLKPKRPVDDGIVWSDDGEMVGYT